MKSKKSLLKFLIGTITTVSLITGSATSSFAASKPVNKATLSSTPLYSFSVISDTHVIYNDTDKTINALNCIKNNFNDKCIVINGDVVDNYNEYSTLSRVMSYANNSGSKRLPYVYFNFGNHEFVKDGQGSPEGENYNNLLNNFINSTNSIQSSLGHSDAYRDAGKSYDWKYVNGNLLFFLGTDKIAYDDQINCADLDRNYQLNHLFNKLDTTSGWKFVFCHQPPHGIIHGADWQNCICERAYNDYNGDYFESEISKRSKTIMFASHMHNSFNTYRFTGSNDNFGQLGGCSVFGTSSIKEASQGLHVTVYSDHVNVDAIQYNSGTSYTKLFSKTVR